MSKSLLSNDGSMTEKEIKDADSHGKKNSDDKNYNGRNKYVQLYALVPGETVK